MPPARTEQPSRSGESFRRVLVDDDDEAAVDAIEELIRLCLCCHVHVAYSGADAVDQACRFRPDTVVMDNAMPFVNGMEAGEILGRLCGRRRPRLIALTALSSDRDRLAIQATGFTAHLVKPVDVEQLIALLVQPV